MNDQLWKALDEVIANEVVPHAQVVDLQGVFPSKAMEALGDAGVLGATVPKDAGGAGLGLAEAATIVELLSRACGSTAMVTMMHFAAVPILVAHGPRDIVGQIAAGRHLSTLAFSEAGSRSHFWAPVGTASPAGEGRVALNARKSWVTSAGNADSYVWSSRALAADGPMTLWFVPAATAGVSISGGFDGLGLRGNGSRPVRAENAVVGPTAMLGADGQGLDLAMQLTLPWFLVLNAAFSVGLAEAAVREAIGHVTGARLEHLGQRLVDQPLVRNDIGRMRLRTDAARAVLHDTVAAVESGREDAGLRVLEVKAIAAETAIEVTDLAMKTCGGAAFRKDLGIERRFRDARAARVMAPTTDHLTDFVARESCGMPLLDGA
ncbi:acyl-CoA dehydrogenase family protein [Virgisporangium ochraceum]|uniref:Acyl-CoA dehydrogenase n=1 Tax=Virgisporangium ochraceum TaxID=65505 RepID=A0A8J3ZY57_9ACTN|nr:acyl-CoA dehydrogenase family protein [Virgisporangium ochraceum]GIJ70665.1 acyl-CoA dehydrogenase [Virgisporangium ochraceum]